MDKKVIIDCDPGIDDTLALMLALASPELEIVAITVVCGNVPTALGVENVFRCLERADRLDIPVHAGAEKPLQRAFISAQDTHGEDGLGETNLPRTSTTRPQAISAADFLAEYFAEDHQTGLIALGPLTNIALALQQNPALGKNILRFVTMGGSYKSHGNCSPVAEYNYWCDPEAAKFVYENLGTMIEMVGLDVTRQIVFTPDILEYCQQMAPEQGQYLASITRFYFDFHWIHERILGCVINDPLAVHYYLDPTICNGFTAYTTVETAGLSYGQSLVDAYGIWGKPDNSRILTEVDPQRFFLKFLTAVLNAQTEVVARDLKNLRIGEG